jgi:hypothetical protein
MIARLRLVLPFVIGLVIGMMPGLDAYAQQPVRGQSVALRERPDYAPIGARLGAFTFDPYIGASELFDDNIFFAAHNPDADFISTATFGLLSKVALERLSLRLDTGGEIVRYVKNTSQDYWQGHFSIDGRYDIDPGLAVVGLIESSRLAQPRDAVDAVNSRTPTIYYDTNASVGLVKNAGRFNAAATFAYQRLQYENSEGADGTIDNGPLDRNQWAFDGLVGYNYVGTQNVFVRFQGNIRDYPQPVNNAGFRDSSKGFALTTGADFDFDGVITGRLEVGYEQQTYDDSQIGTTAGPLVNLDVLWNPTQLTSVSGSFNYEFVESINNASPGYWRSLVTVGVTHELQRNLLLNGQLELLHREFVNSSGVENQLGLTVGGRYFIDNGLTLDAHYLFRVQDEVNGSHDYVKNAIFIQLRKVF